VHDVESFVSFIPATILMMQTICDYQATNLGMVNFFHKWEVCAILSMNKITFLV
jgi:hypothetical protein